MSCGKATGTPLDPDQSPMLWDMLIVSIPDVVPPPRRRSDSAESPRSSTSRAKSLVRADWRAVFGDAKRRCHGACWRDRHGAGGLADGCVWSGFGDPPHRPARPPSQLRAVRHAHRRSQHAWSAPFSLEATRSLSGMKRSLEERGAHFLETVRVSGTRCFNSSDQCSTTTMLAGATFGSPAALSLSIRNRLPSGDTS